MYDHAQVVDFWNKDVEFKIRVQPFSVKAGLTWLFWRVMFAVCALYCLQGQIVVDGVMMTFSLFAGNIPAIYVEGVCKPYLKGVRWLRVEVHFSERVRPAEHRLGQRFR